MTFKNITFIGAGNMAQAIVSGLLENGYPAKNIKMTNRSAKKQQPFKNEGVCVIQNNSEAIVGADVIVLAVKPHQIALICDEIKNTVTKSTLIISMAAGITTDFISTQLGGKCPIVRTMPNTGATVSAGVTGIFANDEVSDDDIEFVESLFLGISMVIWLEDEQLVPVVTAASGSGIAYFFRFMEVMQHEAMNLGLPEDVVKLMIAQTALGASKLALESEKSFGALIRDVASPNGVTQSALDSLDHDGIDETIVEAMRAALARSKEMTEDLCNS